MNGFSHPLDILLGMSTRKLDLGLELRREIIAGFGCYQCTIVINVVGLDKVNEGSITDREEQTKGSGSPRRKIQAICRIPGSASFTWGDPYWEQW